MPLLSPMLELKNNWYIGEVLLILLVFIPSYYWARVFYLDVNTKFRSLFQVITFACFLFLIIPFMMEHYSLINFSEILINSYIIQLIIIVSFPALIAVYDLTILGKGTPFPYDKTKTLVQTGIYAYCRNPIQWSFTFLFFILCYIFSSYYMLIGAIVSVAYSYGISDFQENIDMKKRYSGDWECYKKRTPKWYFQWKAKDIPRGCIYFDYDCFQCNQFMNWFLNSNCQNLDIKLSSEYPSNNILKVTYIDHQKKEFKSVTAIAFAFEHINLAYASLGWFMRFPIINFILQTIVDSLEINRIPDEDS